MAPVLQAGNYAGPVEPRALIETVRGIRQIQLSFKLIAPDPDVGITRDIWHQSDP